MTPETSLDLTPSFKTSVDAKVKGLGFNVDYLENSKELWQKKISTEHTIFVFWTVIFLFARSIYTFDDF